MYSDVRKRASLSLYTLPDFGPLINKTKVNDNLVSNMKKHSILMWKINGCSAETLTSVNA